MRINLNEQTGTYSGSGFRVEYDWDDGTLEYDLFVSGEDAPLYSGSAKGSSLNHAINSSLKAVASAYEDDRDRASLVSSLRSAVDSAEDADIKGYYVSEARSSGITIERLDDGSIRATASPETVKRAGVRAYDVVTKEPYEDAVSFLFNGEMALLTIEQPIIDRSGKLLELSLSVRDSVADSLGIEVPDAP